MHKTVGGAYQFQVENGLLTGKIMGKKINIAYNKSNVFNMNKIPLTIFDISYDLL